MDAVLRWFLRIVALFYLFGALVHAGNLLGLGHAASSDPPTLYRVLDVVYLVLDLAVVVGLLMGARWGVALFFVAALSQLVLYLGFPETFSRTPEEREALTGLVYFHVGTLLIYGVLRLLNK